MTEGGKRGAAANSLQDFRFRPLRIIVSQEFDDVLVFLERFQIGPQVDGDPVLQPDLRVRLERFADGLCGEAEREKLCEVLRADPALVRWVAERVKERRKAGQ